MKRKLTVAIALAVGLLHFVTGAGYAGPFPRFVNGCLIDILLPMTFYLLLGMVRWQPVNSPLLRAAAVFLLSCAVEASQYLGWPVFGSVFDPLDVLAYAAGVLLGLLLDLAFFPRLLPRRQGEDLHQAGRNTGKPPGREAA